MSPPLPLPDDLKTAALAALVSVSLSAHAAGEAGRVDYASGSVRSVSQDGTERTLRKGSIVHGGDLIRTRRGRAHIRFSDGAYVSLKPDTEFRVDEYRFEKEQPEQQRGFFSLLRGGARWVTGLIGRRRSESYRLHTAVATIGIRGTHFEVDIAPNPGEVTVSNWPGFHAGLLTLFNELTGQDLGAFPPGTEVVVDTDGSVTFTLGEGGGELTFGGRDVDDALAGLADDQSEFASRWENLPSGTFDNFDAINLVLD